MANYPWQANRNPLALSAGQLRHEIRIQKLDDAGGQGCDSVPAWQTVLVCFAGIDTMSSREVFRAQQFTAQVTHRITIRYPGNIGIGPGLQILFGARIFVVQTVENVQERNRVLYLMCVEVNGLAA